MTHIRTITSWLRRPPKWAVWSLALLPISYVLYVAGVAIALHWGGVQALGALVDDVEMSVESGYSWVPGVFVVRGARFQANDYDVELAIEAEQATLVWSPMAVFEKTLEFQRLEASGVTFHLLHRVEDTPRQRRRVEHFPRISGRSPFYQRPRPEFSPMPFRVRLSHIDAQLSEAWVSEYRTSGVIAARGALVIDDDFEVADARLSLVEGSVFVGERQAIARSSCELGARVGPFQLRDADVHSVFRTITGGGRCEADLEDLSIIDIYTNERPIHVHGTGRVSAKLRLEEGKLVDTHVRTELDVAELGLGEGRVTGAVHTVIEANRSGAAELRIEQKRGKSLGQGRQQLEFEGLALVLQVRQELVTRPQVSALRLSVENFSHGDPQLFSRLIFPEIPRFSTRDTNLDLQLSFVGAERGEWSFEAKTNGEATLHFGDEHSFYCEQQVTLSCEESDGGSTCEFGARCGGGELRLGEELRAPVSFEAGGGRIAVHRNGAWQVDLSMTGSNPKKTLVSLVGDAPLEKMGVRLLPLGPISANLTLSRGSGGAEPPILGEVREIRTGALSGRGRFAWEKGFSSRFLVRSGPLTAGVEQDGRGVRVRPFATKDWFEKG